VLVSRASTRGANMRVFNFDPGDYRDLYSEQGWVHIRNGVSPEFLEVLRDFALRQFVEHKVEGKAIGGTKEQALYEFPEAVDFPGELFDVIAEVGGLKRPTMTLSERHIKAYDDDAPAFPSAHKDRVSSQISVGLSIDIPEGSQLVLYPFEDVGVNPFNVSPALRESLEPEQQPDVVLQGAREVVINDKAGDVVMFPGSAVWHLRRHSARAVNLYLKFNDFNSDPLGEDPITPVRRAETLEALGEGDDAVLALVPVLGRRLDTVTRQYTRNAWQEVVQANVWNERPVTLSEQEFRLVQSVDGERTAAELLGGIGLNGGGTASIRRLAERGVIDLVESSVLAAGTGSASLARTRA
jgi:hypothetical protein